MSEASRSTDPPEPAGRSKRGVSRLPLIALLVFAAGILIVFRSETQSGDSLEYARSIRDGTNLFHPHHLLFNPIVRGVWMGLRFFHPAASPFDAAQVHNIFWALVALAAVFVIVRRMTASPGLAVLFTLALFACVGFWQYATFVEVYLPAMGCLALVLAILHPLRKTPPSFGGRVLLVGLFCLAVLYDQIGVLFTVPFAFLLARRLGPKSGKAAGAMIAASGAIVLACYGAAFLTTTAPKTVSGFIHWCLSYAFYPDPRWGSWSNISIMGGAKILLSFARNVLIVPPALFLPGAVSAGLILAVLVLGSLRAIIRRAPEADFRVALLLWLGLTVAFIWWFTPYGFELYIPLFPLLFLLGARLVADRRAAGWGRPPARRFLFGASAAAVAGLGALNLITAVLPAHADRGAEYARAVRMNASAPAGSILIADFELRENLLYYFPGPKAIEDGPLLYSFYRHWTLGPDRAVEPGRPVLATVSFLSPASLSAKPFNADDFPKEWRSFMEWMLDCEIRDGKVIAARLPSGIAGLPGYLLLSGERGPVAGLADLFSRLDEKAAQTDPSWADLFSAWLGRHPDLVR